MRLSSSAPSLSAMATEGFLRLITGPLWLSLYTEKPYQSISTDASATYLIHLPSGDGMGARTRSISGAVCMSGELSN